MGERPMERERAAGNAFVRHCECVDSELESAPVFRTGQTGGKNTEFFVWMFLFNNLFHPFAGAKAGDCRPEWGAVRQEEAKTADFQFRILPGWKKISRFAETFRCRSFMAAWEGA